MHHHWHRPWRLPLCRCIRSSILKHRTPAKDVDSSSSSTHVSINTQILLGGGGEQKRSKWVVSRKEVDTSHNRPTHRTRNRKKIAEKMQCSMRTSASLQWHAAAPRWYGHPLPRRAHPTTCPGGRSLAGSLRSCPLVPSRRCMPVFPLQSWPLAVLPRLCAAASQQQLQLDQPQHLCMKTSQPKYSIHSKSAERQYAARVVTASWRSHHACRHHLAGNDGSNRVDSDHDA